MKHNIEYEKKFIDLLGYSIDGHSNNRWLIFDENDRQTGFIEYRIENNRFIYYTKIDNNKIYCEFTRDINDSELKYLFTIKKLTGNDVVSLCLSNNPYLTIWKCNNGFIKINKTIITFPYS